MTQPAPTTATPEPQTPPIAVVEPPVPTDVPVVPDAAESTAEQPEAPTDQTPSGKFASIRERFRNGLDAFVRKHLKGEHIEPSTELNKINKVELAKAIGGGAIGLAASLGGIKSLVDLPRWFIQKYYTHEEQKRIQIALTHAETQTDETDPSLVKIKLPDGTKDDGWRMIEEMPDGKIKVKKKYESGIEAEQILLESEIEKPTIVSPLEAKKRRLAEAINESKYLSPQKKQELLQKLNDTVETYDARLEELKGERNEQIAKLLDEAIETRVKGTTALKETLNTALIATGLATLRGIAYGGVALYERFVKVQKERGTGERTGTLGKELVTNGFLETWDKLRGRTGETKMKKALNVVQALGTVGRFVGFAGLAAGEMSGEGGPSAAINKALEAFEQKGILHASTDNYLDQFDRVKNIATLGLLKDDAPVATAEPATEEVSQVADPEAPTPTDAATPEALPEPVTSTGDTVEPEPSAAGTTFEEPDVIKATDEVPVDTDSEVAPENVNETISQEELKTGTVQKGDGMIRVVQRQLKANPEKFGYTGDPDDKKALGKWVRRTAFSATKQAGFINQDGWLGLRGKSIDKLSIGLTNDQGKISFNFYDAKSGVAVTTEEMRAQNLVHDYQKPSQITEDAPYQPPTESNVDSRPKIEILEDEPRAKIEILQDEPEETSAPDAQDAPNPEPPPFIKELRAELGIDDSQPDTELEGSNAPEVSLEVEGSVAPSAETDASSVMPDVDVDTGNSTDVAAHADTSVDGVDKIEHVPGSPVETVKIASGSANFVHEQGKIVGFKFDRPASGEDIARATARFGTSKDEVYGAFIKQLPDQKNWWTINGKADNLLVRMEQQTRADGLLKEMESQGLKDTDEYRFVKKQSGMLKGLIKRSFNNLGMTEKVEQLEHTLSNVKEEVVPDALAKEVIPVSKPIPDDALSKSRGTP